MSITTGAEETLERDVETELTALAAGGPVLPKHVDAMIERHSSAGLPVKDLAARKKLGDALVAKSRAERPRGASSLPPPAVAPAPQPVENPLPQMMSPNATDSFLATYPWAWQGAAMLLGALVIVSAWVIFPSVNGVNHNRIPRRALSALGSIIFLIGGIPAYRRWSSQ